MVLTSLHRPLPGRRIAAHAGASTSRTNVVLNDLVEAGIVRMTPARPAILYELNRDHVLAGVIEQLPELHSRWRDKMADKVATWARAPSAAVLLGSAVPGTGGDDNDIHLVLLRPDDIPADDETWVEQRDDLRASVREWTGNTLNIIDIVRLEFMTNENLFREVVRTEGDVLHGALSILPW